MRNSIDKILICGAGTMGAGIAQTAIQAGLTTWLFDKDKAALENGAAQIDHFFQRAVEKGKITEEEKKQTISRLYLTQNFKEADPQVVIEAIVENMDAKVSLFKELAENFSAETIFATNTSSLSVSQIAQEIPHNERVIGMHFFNPVPLMELVEIIKASQTSLAVTEDIHALVVKMNKIGVMLQDTPGFIVNRVARPFYLEAFRLAEDQVADMKTIDRLMEGIGFRMGPFALTDLIGQEVNLAVTQSLYHAFHFEARYRPSPLQVTKVKAGLLGRKSGTGFYDYQ